MWRVSPQSEDYASEPLQMTVSCMKKRMPIFVILSKKPSAL